MSNATVILCPGQGAQTVGMGKTLIESSPAAEAMFAQAKAISGLDIKTLCLAGPEELLNQTDVSQPAIYTTGVVSYRAAVDQGKIPSDPAMFAGLSLGEYTALHLAGVFSFEDGLRLVTARGRYMQEAAVASPSGMVAIMGADESQIRQLCDVCRQQSVLVPANFNAPGQVVVSGSKDACERIVPAAEAAGFKAVPLKVAGAFHSPLMQPAADRMVEELQAVEFHPPVAKVFANVTAEPHTTPDAIRRLLVDQIVLPVRWEQTMVPLAARPDLRFVELSPGRTLAGLMKRISRRLPVESLDA